MPFAPRRLLIVIGIILLALAAWLAWSGLSRSYARRDILINKIDQAAFDIPRVKEVEGKPVAPKLASSCFNPNLDLKADAQKVSPDAVIRLSTQGIIGGFNYGEVSYQWTASAGKLTQDGKTAMLDTRGISKSMEIAVRVEATGKSGLCRARSPERRIQVLAPYNPPSLTIEPGQVATEAFPNLRRTAGAICTGDGIRLRANTNLANARYEWQANGGEISGDGAEAIFRSPGLDPGIYTVTVRARSGEDLAFDSIPITVVECTQSGMQLNPCPRQFPININRDKSDGGILFSIDRSDLTQAGIYRFAWSSSSGRMFGRGGVAWFDRNSAPFEDNFDVVLTITGDQPQCRFSYQTQGQIEVNKTLYYIQTPTCDFAANSLELNQTCRQSLKKLADNLNKDAAGRAWIDVYRLPAEIEGFDLLRGRAIRQHLVTTYGIAKDRILIRSGGISTYLSGQAGSVSTYLKFSGGRDPIPDGPAVVFFEDDAGPSGLKFQEEVTGSWPSRMEAEEEERVSLRFSRRVSSLPQASPTVKVDGDKTTATQPVEPIPSDRDLSVALEEALGRDFELWIRASLTSSQFELKPSSPEMADWRKLAYAGTIDWEWTIRPLSDTPIQNIDANVEIEWRPKPGVNAETVRHTLWKDTLRIDVDNPVLKQSRIRIAAPAFSVAGLACLLLGVWPLRKIKAEAPDSSYKIVIKHPIDEILKESPPQSPPLEGAEPPLEKANGGGSPTTAPTLAGVPEQPQSSDQDLVECSVFAPPSTVPAATILIQIFAHLREQADETERLAREFDEEARRRAVKTLASKIPRGSELMFDLHIANWRIDEPVQKLTWNGYPESVQFAVDVPPDCKPGNAAGKVTVSRDSVPIGHISFIIKVGATAAPENELTGIDAKRYSYVFISYASADRSEVLERVQMLETLGIKYFQDLLSLDPGDRWEKKLYENIDKCDLFLLFWSQNAKDSKWVIKEAEYALARKHGDDDAPPEIKPVIIQGPPIVLPPPSLEHLHFNDRIIYFSRK
ncbi:MAG: toll/interleukin-1 receptor domain-containing protein [Blastocatellales bacterium]